MKEDINVILKPLRKIILTENSLEPKKEVFPLSHVNKFIAIEKKMALKSLKKKMKLHKRMKEDDAVNENNTDLLPTREEVQVAKMAVCDWEEAASDVIHVAQEGKGQEVLDSLVAALKLEEVCKRGIVFCLVILIKKSNDLNIIAKGYSAVAQICRSSNLFLLFIELCKIYSAANTRNSGWGRGMKRAIRNWYLQWEPRLLALEVTRYPSAYTWSHKDVLKMSHISLKDLPTETRVVLNFIFSGFENTRQKYASEENAKDLIHLLEILHKGANESNSDAVVERGKNILNKFGSVTLSDFSTQALNDSKVMSFLLENGTPQLVIEALASTSLFKLINSNAELRALLSKQVEREGFCREVDLMKTIIAYNNCRRICAELLQKEDSTKASGDATKEKQWMKHAPPNPDKTKKLCAVVPRPRSIDNVFAALGKLVTEGTKNVAKMEKKVLVFVDIEPSIDRFIAVSPEDPISKEVRGTQAISFLILSLTSCHSSLESVVPLLAQKIKNGEDSKASCCTFTSLQSGLSKLAKAQANHLNVGDSLKAALGNKASTCVFLYFKLIKELMKDIYDKFKELKSQDATSELRVVVCGLDRSLAADVTPFQHPDLLFLFGFNRSILPVIRAFNNGFL